MITFGLGFGPAVRAEDNATAPPGWHTAAPRPEIAPAFAYEAKGGAGGQGAFVIRADKREGLDGCWTKTFSVVGGKHYRFSALYQAQAVAVARRSIVAKIDWQDAQGRSV
ncbi:MAG TPA: carbon-nitrogen hydrolase family protein, partial [Bacillota bacterium]|nr:carbon-nitrogen hydrolase family protein [Bacillota bacterium]